MKIGHIAGMIFYVVVNFISPMNSKPISQIRAYYQKEGIVIKIQGDDYYGDISSEWNEEVGERRQEIQDMHNILALGGWQNIEYYELESKPPIKISIFLNQKETLFGKNYYGVYFLENKKNEKTFIDYQGSYFKYSILNQLKMGVAAH